MPKTKKTASPEIGDYVEVKWTDACSMSGWYDLEDYDKSGPVACITVGHLVSKTTDKLTIGLTICENTSMNGAISVPAKWVKEVRVLK